MTDASPFHGELPTTLDDIVRRNRHVLEIGLATASELAAVSGDVDTKGTPRARIESWHLIALRHRMLGRTTVHMLGHVRQAPWITSYVAVLAHDHSRVRTKNSLYKLRAEDHGEPGLILIFLVAATLRRWGLDDRYDLGVMPIPPHFAPPP